MIRVDAVHSDPARDPAEQRSVAAVVAIPAVQSGGQPGQQDENLANMKKAVDTLSEKTSRRSVHVDLSGAGKAMAGTGQTARAKSNSDIDESGLPDAIKALLKRIRKIREDLQEKQAQLREVLADTKMQPERRKMKVAILRTEIMALSAALIGASNALAKLTRELGLSQEQSMAAGRLMLAG